MSEKHSGIYLANNLTDLTYQFKAVHDLKIVGACTGLKEMPEKCISTTLMNDFKQINKHERFIEFGPGTSLSDILNLGERNLPLVLLESIETVANPFVRNIATLAGNIMNPNVKCTLFAPMIALDTILEFRTTSEVRFVPLLNFTEIPKGFFLTNIRVPTNDWDVSIFRRLGPANKISEDSASFAFLADSEKSVITNLKIAFSGKVTFRCLELENKLLGIKLPVSTSDIAGYVEEATAQFDKAADGQKYNPVLRQQFMNLVRYAFEQLS